MAPSQCSLRGPRGPLGRPPAAHALLHEIVGALPFADGPICCTPAHTSRALRKDNPAFGASSRHRTPLIHHIVHVAHVADHGRFRQDRTFDAPQCGASPSAFRLGYRSRNRRRHLASRWTGTAASARRAAREHKWACVRTGHRPTTRRFRHCAPWLLPPAGAAVGLVAASLRAFAASAHLFFCCVGMHSHPHRCTYCVQPPSVNSTRAPRPWGVKQQESVTLSESLHP